jgi:transcriptional regulator of arginine metabolism
MNKDATSSTARREAIRDLMRRSPPRSQEEILERLSARGLEVTQPTLSRDLKALGVAKTPQGYVIPEDGEIAPGAAREERLRQALREFAAGVELAGTLVVLRTPPAAAQPLARAIDAARPEGAVGTIAGDDTVFVAAPSLAAARRLAARLRGASRGRRT